MKTKYYEINYWSEKKLEYFKKYLEAYTKIFYNQSWARGITYIDLFAGPGICYSTKNKKSVYGSPIIALNTKPPFSSYIFCDIDINNINNLKKLAKDNKGVFVIKGDANEFVKELVTKLKEDIPAFVFLDPQALDLNYQTIELLAKNKKRVDFLINFPVGGPLFRSIGSKKCVKCTTNTKCPKCIDLLFGNNDWRSLATLYHRKQIILPEFLKQLLRLYMKPLENLGFRWAVQHIRNSKGTLLYDLIFATRNLTGMKIMRDVMFKDRPPQLQLWSDSYELSQAIFDTYKNHNGKLILKTVLEKMLIGDNTYRLKDFQESLRVLEDGGNIKRVNPKSKRVKNFKDAEEFVMVYNKNNERNNSASAQNIP